LIRTLRREDLERVFAIQCRAHAPAYHEPVEALASRIECGEGFCLACDAPEGLTAYLLAHPWRGAPPALHTPLVPPAEADHLFLHDLAILPGHQGKGIAAALIENLLALASSRFAGIRLVALAGVEDFWRRQGWQPLAATLESNYGVGARLMGRPLA
jgi:GNAT superfamily N-acetyltransferase